MAKIITVFNQKGGAGKTTTAVQLAGTMGYRGFDVLIADLDPQGTTSKWVSRSDVFPATLWTGHRYTAEGVQAELKKLSAKFDLIVIDCAPSIDQPGTWSSLLVSDLAIIATKLGPADLDSLPGALALAKEGHRASGRTYPVRILPTAYRKARADERLALEQLANNKQYPEYKLLETSLADRVAYTRSMLYGVTVHSIPKSADAIAEIDSLADEISEILSIPLSKGNADE